MFSRSRRRYRPKLFPWCTAEDAGSLVGLLILMAFAIFGLPVLRPLLQGLLAAAGVTIGEP